MVLGGAHTGPEIRPLGECPAYSVVGQDLVNTLHLVREVEILRNVFDPLPNHRCLNDILRAHSRATLRGDCSSSWTRPKRQLD